MINTIKNSVLIALVVCFSQCSSSQKAMKVNKTITVKQTQATDVYYQHWIAGVQGGGSGTNVFVAQSVLNDIVPVEAFFRNSISVIEPVKQHGKIYFVGRFKGTANQTKDYIMDGEAKQEHQNTIDSKPKQKRPFPFDLADDELVLSYKKDNAINFLKLKGIQEKPLQAYPSAPRQ